MRASGRHWWLVGSQRLARQPKKRPVWLCGVWQGESGKQNWSRCQRNNTLTMLAARWNDGYSSNTWTEFFWTAAGAGGLRFGHVKCTADKFCWTRVWWTGRSEWLWGSSRSWRLQVVGLLVRRKSYRQFHSLLTPEYIIKVIVVLVPRREWTESNSVVPVLATNILEKWRWSIEGHMRMWWVQLWLSFVDQFVCVIDVVCFFYWVAHRFTDGPVVISNQVKGPWSRTE